MTASAQNLFYNRLIKFVSTAREFFYSRFFPVELALISFLFYVADLSVVALSVYVVIGCFLLLSGKDMTPVLPLLFMVTFVFRNLSVFSEPVVYCIFGFAFVAVVLHFIIYPVKKILFSKLLIPVVLFSLALLFGGIGSPYYKSDFSRGIAVSVGLGIGIPIEFFVLSQYIRPKKNFDVKKYVAFLMICVAFLTGFELIYGKTALALWGDQSFRAGYYPDVDAVYESSLGWGNINYIGYICLLAIPCACYLMVKTKKVPLYFFICIALFGFIFVSGSDGGLGIGLVYSAVLIVFTYLKLDRDDKRLFARLVSLAVCAIFAGVCCWLLYDANALSFLLKHFLTDTGRSELYRLGLGAFRERKLFGVGIGYAYNPAHKDAFYPWAGRNYHSSFVHVLATMGIVGMAIYLFYLGARIYEFFSLKDDYGFYFGFAFIMYETYASIDCGEFIMLMLIITAFLSIAVYLKTLPPEQQPLPVSLSKNALKIRKNRLRIRSV